MSRLLFVLVSWQDRLLRWWACRSGHADTLVLTSTRIYLQCATCGRKTPGWACYLNQGVMGDAAD